jgi:hypothetical protein
VARMNDRGGRTSAVRSRTPTAGSMTSPAEGAMNLAGQSAPSRISMIARGDERVYRCRRAIVFCPLIHQAQEHGLPSQLRTQSQKRT